MSATEVVKKNGQTIVVDIFTKRRVPLNEEAYILAVTRSKDDQKDPPPEKTPV